MAGTFPARIELMQSVDGTKIMKEKSVGMDAA
jgi:hypothetical protein